jgi:hypothetical protein
MANLPNEKANDLLVPNLSKQNGRYVATKAVLAGRLGISYYTLIHRFDKLPSHPRAHSPGSAPYDVAAWREFIQARKYAHISKVDSTTRAQLRMHARMAGKSKRLLKSGGAGWLSHKNCANGLPSGR